MQIVGHKKQIKYLDNILKNKEAIPHAFLFVGPDKVGKKKVALEFMKAIQCETNNNIEMICGDCSGCRQIDNVGADFLLIDQNSAKKDSDEIGIASIRELRLFAGSRPAHGRFKIALIDGASNMTIEAQNALLKVLEEPSGDKLFFLLSSSADGLLDTIISRSCIVKFNLLSKQEIDEVINSISLSQKDFARINNILPIIGGRPGIIKEFEGDIKILDNRQRAMEDLFAFIESDLNKRFGYIEKNIKSDDFSPIFLLENWIALLQEALFKKIENCGLMNVDRLLAELIQKKDLATIADYLKLANDIYFLIKNTNTNQRLALEMLAINFQ